MSTTATTILRQIPSAVKMSLGFHAPRTIPGGVSFAARILPFNKDGKRSGKPRNMQVDITLNGLDYYDIKVWYLYQLEMVIHYEITNVTADQLGWILLALDYDGATILNPRFQR